MGLNFLLVIVGLIICFGGIYLRRICSGILGLLCGVLGAFALALVTVGLWSIGNDSTVFAIIICGVICAVFSAIYYKVCAAVSSFLSAFAFVVLLLAIASDMDSGAGIIAIAVIIALIIAGISIKFYDYSFIITSAVVGAFIASIGGFGIVHDCDLEDTLFEIIWYSEQLSSILISTIILSVIGFFVQLGRLRRNSRATNSSSQRNSDSSERFGQTVATISEQAKRIGQATAPVLQNVGNQATDIWKQASSEKGRSDLKEELLKEKVLFIAPIIAFVLSPVITKISGYGGFYNFYSWICNFASAVSLGTLVYFILKKDRRFAFFLTLVYTVGYLLFILLNPSLLRYSFWYVLVELLDYLIIWFVLDLISTKIKREEIKPILILIIGIVLEMYIINWLAQFRIYLFFRLNTFVFFAVSFITLYFLFKKRDDISIVSLNRVKN